MSQQMRQALGQVLAEAREKAKRTRPDGLTHQDIAEALDANATQPWRWESGLRWPPDDAIAFYAEASGQTVDQLWTSAMTRRGELQAAADASHARAAAAKAKRRTTRRRRE